MKSIRPFIGARDYELSRGFYRALGFTETVIDAGMSVFALGPVAFYLQRAYVKDWIDNTMVFVEVEDVQAFWDDLVARDLPAQFPGARITPIRTYDWGRECFVHDPSGVLWHFGEFAR